jgi:hypothetical protein
MEFIVRSDFRVNQTSATIVSTRRTRFESDKEMADPAVLAQLQQLVGQLNALQQTFGNLQASNNTLPTRIATLEAENTTLTAANMTLAAKVQNLPGGAAAGGAAGGGAEAATLVPFAATPAMVNHQDLINYSTKVGTTIYKEGCKKLTTEFDMKSSGTIVYTTELQAKCVKMGWHMGTQQIINFTNAAGSTINIVHQYRQINMVMLQTQCEVFCKKQGGGDNRKQKNKKNNTNKKEQKRDKNWKKTPPKEREMHEKKVKGHTWRWCKHHMAQGNHKEELCRLGNERTNQRTRGLNQVAAQAALATVLNPEWQALMANMARNMAND